MTPARGNDHWFQHISIIVSDMDHAYQRLKQNNAQQVSPEPQILPEWNQNVAGIRVLYFKDPDGHFVEFSYGQPLGPGALTPEQP